MPVLPTNLALFISDAVHVLAGRNQAGQLKIARGVSTLASVDGARGKADDEG